MKSWLKVILIVLIGLVLVALTLLGRIYWWGKPKPEATVVLTLPPTPAEALTVEGLNPPAAKPEWVEKMRAYEKRAQWLDAPTWVSETVDTPKGEKQIQFYQLPLVSTGETGTAVVMLQDGRKFEVNVLYALYYNVVGQTVVLPIVTAITHGVGTVRFSEKNLGLPLGKVFFAIMSTPLATPIGIQWEQCTPGSMGLPQAPPWACDFGEAVEKRWPGYTALILRRVLTLQQIPEGFFLYGIHITPLNPPPEWDKTMPDLSTWEVSP